MKKITNLLILIFVFIFMSNVKADMGPPSVIKYYVTVVNKSGAPCYEVNSQNNYVKTKDTIPYGTTLYVTDEAVNSKYINTYSDEPTGKSCLIALSDTMIKNGNFDIKSEEVEKIDSIKAVILAKGGLNLRKGPAMSYGRIITIPQYAVVTISYKAGTYWFYAEYNGQKGWISGINQYLGYEGNDVLYNNIDTNIYNENGKIIGTIPKYTDITDYINVVNRKNDYAHYVNYNGIKGYTYQLSPKVDGELKVINDAYVYDGSKVINKVKEGQTVKYIMIKTGKNYDDSPATNWEIYSPELKGSLFLIYNDVQKEYTPIKETPIKKLKGYIGEGLFGEEKEEKQEVINDVTPPVVEDDNINNNQKTNNTMIIIICLLCTIIGALTCFIIIKLVNTKKDKKGVVNENEQK